MAKKIQQTSKQTDQKIKYDKKKYPQIYLHIRAIATMHRTWKMQVQIERQNIRE
jgi:hypothetical protein